jgi:hypothetical protein
MYTDTVTPDVLNSPQAAEYFTRADRRVMIGLRACLEMLGLPVPDYAKRRMPGATPAKAMLAAYHADNPQPRPIVIAGRKANASPERIADLQALRATRLG